ncbi:proline-rich transmembrane protein 1-like [Glandiceps talaboti]
MESERSGLTYKRLREDAPIMPSAPCQPNEVAHRQYHDEPSTAIPVGATVPLVTMAPPNHSIVRVAEPIPNDYMGLAIFVTICCFWPLGIFAILKARDVHKRAWQGNMEAARQSSSSARFFSLIGLGLGICAYVILVIVVIVGVAQQIWLFKTTGGSPAYVTVTEQIWIPNGA